MSYPETDLRPSFTVLKEVLDDARLALVLERLGSGFKLKTLDYIFFRVPIVAFPNAMAGSNLEPGVDYVGGKDLVDALLRAEGVIDDFSKLNTMQESANFKALNNFNWSDRADSLLHFIEEHEVS